MNLNLNVSSQDLLRNGKDAIRIAEKTFYSIAQLTEEACNFATVFFRWSKAWEAVSNIINPLNFLQNVSPDEKVRNASVELETFYSKWSIEQCTNKQLYHRFQWAVEKKEDMSYIDLRFLTHTMKDFKLSGLALEEKELEIYRDKSKRLSELEIQFSKNIADGEQQMEFKKDDLIGVPDKDMDRMFQKDDVYVVTTQYPDVGTVLDNCSVSETRRAVYRLHAGKCLNNLPVLTVMVRLRYELAELIGFKSHIDVQAQNMIMKSEDGVMKFLQEVLQKITPIVETEKKQHEGVNMWDFSYKKQQYMKTQHKLDHVEISKHFPTQHVIAKTLELFQNFFHVDFKKINLPKTSDYGNSDTLAYQVFDRQGKKMLGEFILDLFPRKGKYNHAAMWPLQTSPHVVAALVTNFDRTFLTFADVQTFFHEFGHIIHEILGGGKSHSKLSGTEVETDFVETPSQILEHWCFEPKVLEIISSPSLDDDIVTRLKQTKYIFESLSRLRQVVLSLTDLALYTDPKPPSEDKIKTLWVDNANKYLWNCDKDCILMCCWGHMVGYSAEYYSYTVSAVIAHDMYGRFLNNPLDPALGLEYRTKVLEPGGTKDAVDIIRVFLDRDFSVNNYIELLSSNT